MDGGQMCFLEKVQLGEKQWKAFKIVSELLCENWFDLVTNFVNNWWQNLLRTTRSLQVRVLNVFELVINTSQSYLKAI